MTRQELHNRAVDMADCIVNDMGFHPQTHIISNILLAMNDLTDYLEKRLVETYEAGRVADINKDLRE